MRTETRRNLLTSTSTLRVTRPREHSAGIEVRDAAGHPVDVEVDE